jgi:pimeloyl-ACP methyl ester carboxylesterase
MSSATPETLYACSGNVRIAYQVLGEGPPDLVFVPGVISNVEYVWQHPAGAARWFRRLASLSRLIWFDKRGTGVSDRVADIPTLETRMDDVRAVMDSVASERAVLMGVSEGGPMCALFAATYPQRTSGLVLWGSLPKFVRAPDYPWAPTFDESLNGIAEVGGRWGSREYCLEVLHKAAPSMADDESLARWWVSYMRLGASPAAAAALYRMNMEIDVREVLSAIRVPTLILHRSDDLLVDVRHSRYMAERIPGARYVELPGRDHFAWAGDTERALDELRGFLAGLRDRAEPDRVLATVLFTDIVGSTARVTELGDMAWRELLSDHNFRVRTQLARFNGREIDTAGDGFFASGFDGPARAIGCACAIVDAAREIGLQLRVGLHTGECELIDDKLGGIAVSIGARVAAQAQPGEVLVSSTVKDLVAGSGIAFTDRGTAELKGVSGEWRLFAVER